MSNLLYSSVFFFLTVGLHVCSSGTITLLCYLDSSSYCWCYYYFVVIIIHLKIVGNQDSNFGIISFQLVTLNLRLKHWHNFFLKKTGSSVKIMARKHIQYHNIKHEEFCCYNLVVCKVDCSAVSSSQWYFRSDSPWKWEKGRDHLEFYPLLTLVSIHLRNILFTIKIVLVTLASFNIKFFSCADISVTNTSS